MTREEYLAKAVQAVELAKKHGLYVTYSAEDSTRADLDFLKRIFNEIARAGANTVRVVDTVGAITPLAMRYLVREIRKAVDIPVEIHCHNDHGLALANTLAALEEGASVISSSIDGLGERAGLAATEEIIITLHNLYGIRSFNTKSLFELCKLVENLSRIKISPNKPVVGENVFAHTTGIHQHGVLENPTTYEPYPPELVGRERSLLLGKLSGTHAVVHKLHALGYNAPREKVTEVLAAVKEMSEKRRSALSDSEFAEIAQQVLKKRKDES
jgi:isopropylmalate/homocitrate/citramalate synthase